MTEILPEPPIPADVDLRGFPGFILDVDRLLASELVALGTPEECWAAMMLWCRAWKQTPHGSLPNDDRVLAAFSGAGGKWKKIKPMALRGFQLHSDGRLYHRVIVEQVLAAWRKRDKYRNDQERLKNWREKKRGNASQPPDETDGETDSETRFNGVSGGVSSDVSEREGRRREKEKKNPPTPQGASGGGLFDPADIDGWEVSKRDGKNHPVVNGYYLDLTWDLIVEAASINEKTWRSDLKPLVRWLRADVDPETIAKVVGRMARSDPDFRPFTLKPFDAAVMAHAKEAAA